MSKHTPGPWVIGMGADRAPIIHTKPDSWSPFGQGVAHVCRRPENGSAMEANANLIVAAPEMYEALKGIKDYAEEEIRSWCADVQEGGNPDSAQRHKWDAVLVAIAKAEGRS
jgi:hypothetical protein